MPPYQVSGMLKLDNNEAFFHQRKITTWISELKWYIDMAILLQAWFARASLECGLPFTLELVSFK
jgi:hypothetical protein